MLSLFILFAALLGSTSADYKEDMEKAVDDFLVSQKKYLRDFDLSDSQMNHSVFPLFPDWPMDTTLVKLNTTYASFAGVKSFHRTGSITGRGNGGVVRYNLSLAFEEIHFGFSIDAEIGAGFRRSYNFSFAYPPDTVRMAVTMDVLMNTSSQPNCGFDEHSLLYDPEDFSRVAPVLQTRLSPQDLPGQALADFLAYLLNSFPLPPVALKYNLFNVLKTNFPIMCSRFFLKNPPRYQW